MDVVLKDRRLASAALRQKNMEKREDAARDVEERRIHLLLYGYSSEEDESSEEEDNHHNTYSPIPYSEPDRNPTVETSSESESRTSSYASSLVPRSSICGKSSALPSTGEDGERSLLPFSTLQMQPHIDATTLTTPAPARISVYSTLNRPSDFTLDLLPPGFTPCDFGDTPPDSPSLNPEAPIEIATPVAYSLPCTRPAMVAIRSFTQPPESAVVEEHSAQQARCASPSPQAVQSSARPITRPSLPKIKKCLSSLSIGSVYSAREATPLENSPPPLPAEAKERIIHASCSSTLDSRPKSPLHSAENRNISMKSATFRKPRMSNMKSFIMNPGMTKIRNSKASVCLTISGHTNGDLGKRTSCDYQSPVEALQPLRHRIARASSEDGWTCTPLPAAPTSPMTSTDTKSSGSTMHSMSQKSVSALHVRSKSIGEALRSASSTLRSRERFPVKPNLPTAHSDTEAAQGHTDEIFSMPTIPRLSLDLGSFPLLFVNPLRQHPSSPMVVG